jgi:hypothetical protein
VAVSEQDKLNMIETLHMERFTAWKASLSDEELAEYREIWKNRTDEERSSHRIEVYERNKHRVEQQIADLTGEYEVTIDFVDGFDDEEGEDNPVPVPAAVWLFGSGLLGLAGMMRRGRNHGL